MDKSLDSKNVEFPDYVLDPNAVLKDEKVTWRYGRAPDYTDTRKLYEKTKSRSHAAGSLHSLVENLVKNWEIEASFKTKAEEWRTVDYATYTFSMNGGPPQTAEHMLKVGTYNAIIPPNDFYSPESSDFASSHKTFKRMMPTFAWEVLEVYSEPPVISFKWRHWGVMKNDYVGFNDKGEKVTVKAHGGPIDIQGLTVAHVDKNIRIKKLETWFDPLDMFRQISPDGVVKKETANCDARDKRTSADWEDGEIHLRETNAALSSAKRKASTPQQSPRNLVLTSSSVKPDLKKLLTDLSTAIKALKRGLRAINGFDTTAQSASTASSPISSTCQSWVNVATVPSKEDEIVSESSLVGNDEDVGNGLQNSDTGAGYGSRRISNVTDEEMSPVTKTGCPFLINQN